MARLHPGDARGRRPAWPGPCRHLRHDNPARGQGGGRMSLVFAGICSHAPGITGRASMADPALREPFYAAYRRLGGRLVASRSDALDVMAAANFAHFFMNKMPSFAICITDRSSGPIDDPPELSMPRTSG